MGTLIFHILLVGSFLVADINRKGNYREEEILIEFPDIIPEEEERPEEEAENNEVEQIADATQQQRISLTNRASSGTAVRNEFFDESYRQEVNAAQQLVSDVNKQLSQKIKDLGDIPMPEETTEGMDRDSIKNVIYTGESNIVYYLENRYHLRLPIPVYLAQGGGKVVVDIVVNQQGRVIEAMERKNPAIRDEQIYLYARAAASRTVFNTDYKAPSKQRGTIEYNFVAQ